jgi:hypothetical protein
MASASNGLTEAIGEPEKNCRPRMHSHNEEDGGLTLRTGSSGYVDPGKLATRNCLAYRVETPAGSVVFSSDQTGTNPKFVDFAPASIAATTRSRKSSE